MKLMKDQAQVPKDDQSPATETVAAEEQRSKFMEQQQETEMLASSLIGANVYNISDENLGDINDLVLAKNGGIDAVVVGVGGFLGIGEKNVAVSYKLIQPTTTDSGNVKLVLDVTADELNAAPPFVTLAQLKQQEQMQQDQQLNPNPVPPASPALTN
jgi:sporulation protein YlmC with PRC-barrel domain